VTIVLHEFFKIKRAVNWCCGMKGHVCFLFSWRVLFLCLYYERAIKFSILHFDFCLFHLVGFQSRIKKGGSSQLCLEVDSLDDLEHISGTSVPISSLVR
jgi:hypothetical protein